MQSARVFVRTGLILIACLMLSAAAALAQQTGSIQGKVIDTSGAVLPGVTIEARSDVLPGPRVTTTDVSGVFQMPALPPGEYKVTYTLQGMQTVTKTVRVALADVVISTALEGAIARVVKEGKVRTYDMGGKSSTLDVAKEIAKYAVA